MDDWGGALGRLKQFEVDLQGFEMFWRWFQEIKRSLAINCGG